MKYESALKRKKILTWMNYNEDVIGSEIRQSQEDKYCMNSLRRGKQSSQI